MLDCREEGGGFNNTTFEVFKIFAAFLAFTILSAVVQGVCGSGRIDGPYALDVGRN